MSNRRRAGFRNEYRGEFLRSPAWHARRDRWFDHQRALHLPLACHGCARLAYEGDLELHHLSYAGVIRRDGKWLAYEHHHDLIPLHPYCHELLHRLIDRDGVLAWGRDRRTASLLALVRLRTKLTHLPESP